MSVLPEDLWRKIMEIGVESRTLAYRDLCCLSIACRRLRSLACDDFLWSRLLHSDFPSPRNDFNLTFRERNNVLDLGGARKTAANFKRIYKLRYEKDRNQRRLQQRSLVLKIKGKMNEHLVKIRDIKLQIIDEKDKLEKADAERKHLSNVRSAAVAMNVWQPEVIRLKQEQMVRLNTVSVDSRINMLDMELCICKHRIACLKKSLILEERRLGEATAELASAEYHPLQDFEVASFELRQVKIRSKKLRLSTT